jgi:hypothetical protein
VTLTASPASGWEFSGWSGGVTGSQNPTTFTIEADTEVTATFTEVPADPPPPASVSLGVVTSGSGSVAVSPDKSVFEVGESVTLTASPASGWEFSGWSGGVTGSQNPTTFTIEADTEVTATFTATSDGPQIDVWYGDVQAVGALGRPQRWWNVMGRVSDPAGVASLTAALNGGPEQDLSIGTSNLRLVRPGDFNVEVDLADLLPGSNHLEIRATDSAGNVSATTVTLNNDHEGAAWSLPTQVDWTDATSPGDRAVVVDGNWALTPAGVRTTDPGYDRILAIGEQSWSHYEVTAEVTVHSLDSTAAAGSGVGFGVGWDGHTGTAQPRTGHPLSGMAVYLRRWHETGYRWRVIGPDGYTQVGTSTSTPVLTLGAPYQFKLRVEPAGSDSYRYRFRAWPASGLEPSTWMLDSNLAARSGSLLLVAHEADVTFGPVSVSPLP